jgi:AcrR family transcriptional regulator
MNNEIRQRSGAMNQALAEPLNDRASRSEQARQDTRERILVEAERLFRHYGYSKTTVADIAQALSMSPANVYRFFSSKAEINEAIAERILATKESIALRISQMPLPASERIRHLARSIHQFTVDTFIGESKVHEMVVVALEEQWGTIQHHIIRVTEITAEIIEDGIRAGEFREMPPLLAAQCLMQSLVSLGHPQIVAQCSRTPETYATADQLVDFLLPAMKA